MNRVFSKAQYASLIGKFYLDGCHSCVIITGFPNFWGQADQAINTAVTMGEGDG